MKIVKVESIAVRAPFRAVAYWGVDLWARTADPRVYPPPRRMKPNYAPAAETVIVRLTTDEGIVGYGEAKAPVVPDVTARLIHDLLAPELIGCDPLDIRVIWDRLYSGMRLRGHTRGFLLEAISGIDIALWDTAGKVAGQPIYKLLGGAFHPRVPIYASGLPPVPPSAPADRWDLLTQITRQYVSEGYKMIKVGAGVGVEGDIATVEAVMEAAGPDVALCVDAVCQYDLGQAMSLAERLWERGVAWFEGPMAPEDLAGQAELARRAAIPISYYVMFTHRDLRQLLAFGGVDIIQPDICRCGGISEARRIAELADDFDLAFSLHGSVSSAIAVAAAVQLAAATPNLRAVEYWTDKTGLITEMATTAIAQQDGLVTVPDAPGLGITIDEDALARFTLTQYEYAK